MNNKSRITFCSGVGTVTGANFIFERKNDFKIMVDCGMVQGERFAEKTNRKPFAYDPSSIQALFVTHAHLDHVGRIPKLVKDGFRGRIYSTPQTKTLAELVLNDAVSILSREARQEGISPLYGASEIDAVFPLWNTADYHQRINAIEGVSVFFKDAGHILGSAMIEVSALGNTPPIKMLFTGDLGNSQAPLLEDTESVGDVDYMVMESVYGDRNHEPKGEREGKFVKIIKDTVARGGALVIPAFSIDRTQVLLYELNNFVERGIIQPLPVFVDSPMATKATEIYASNRELFNPQVRAQIQKGDDIFAFPRLEFTVSQNESRDIEKLKGAQIILAGSGMSVGGRVIGHEEFYLPDPKNTILLVGYQTPGSLGRKLAEGAKKVRVNHSDIRVRARVETLYGYSTHKDGDHLISFVSGATDLLKKVFVTMGEPRASMHLAQRIIGELGIKAIMPEIGRFYYL